jgi:hypothetical protein
LLRRERGRALGPVTGVAQGALLLLGQERDHGFLTARGAGDREHRPLVAPAIPVLGEARRAVLLVGLDVLVLLEARRTVFVLRIDRVDAVKSR